MSKVLQWVNRNVWSTKIVVAFAREAAKSVERSRKSGGIANTHELSQKWMAMANHSRNKAMDRRKMTEQAEVRVWGCVYRDGRMCPAPTKREAEEAATTTIIATTTKSDECVRERM